MAFHSNHPDHPDLFAWDDLDEAKAALAVALTREKACLGWADASGEWLGTGKGPKAKARFWSVLNEEGVCSLVPVRCPEDEAFRDPEQDPPGYYWFEV